MAKGTDIMRELIEGGHKGPIVIRSANDSPLHEAMFIKAGTQSSHGRGVLGCQRTVLNGGAVSQGRRQRS